MKTTPQAARRGAGLRGPPPCPQAARRGAGLRGPPPHPQAARRGAGLRAPPPRPQAGPSTHLDEGDRYHEEEQQDDKGCPEAKGT